MSICRRCAAVFDCCMVDRVTEPCWCMQLPLLPAEAVVAAGEDGKTGSCYCPACLQELIFLRENAI
jgi:hypothetical protein